MERQPIERIVNIERVLMRVFDAVSMDDVLKKTENMKPAPLKPAQPTHNKTPLPVQEIKVEAEKVETDGVQLFHGE